MGTVTRRLAVAAMGVVVAFVASMMPPTGVGEASEHLLGCAEPIHDGGEWRMYGHDLSNTRHQEAEATIGPDNAAGLAAAWVFETSGAAFNNTPIVADGCVYLAADDGWVTALDADTGAKAWATQLPISEPGFGGGIVGTPAVNGTDLLVIVNQLGAPYVVALDRTNGAPRWQNVLDDQARAMSNASVVVHDGLVLAGFSGDAYPGNVERGGFAILDAADGAVVAKTYSIADDELAAGYAGAGVWSTAAVDTATGYAYAGASNPHSSQHESSHANAILKLDLDRTRATFGQIVDSYKGRPDTYVDGLAEQPVCETAPDVYYLDRFSASCVQLDLDFGASPNLWSDGATGRTMVGDLQKAGVYHAVDAETMDGVWETVVGVPCLACNAASGSFHDGRVFTAAGPPGQLFSLDAASGSQQWAGHLTGPTSYNAVSSANGVVYVSDSAGTLNAFDAVAGNLLWKHNLGDDTGGDMVSATSSSGVAIARNTVYVAHGLYAIAYRLDGNGGGGGVPGVPSQPADPTVVAGPGAFATNYATPAMVVPQGGSFAFLNGDIALHDVDSDTGAWPDTPLVGLGSSYTVDASQLAAGQYPFHCSIHSNMRGTLVVQ